MRILKFAATLVIVTTLGACASRGMLPDSAAKVEFHSGKEGHTGWSSYREDASFSEVPIDETANAAKAGLGAAGFQITSVDIAKGVVMGEHGITLHDWNLVAGVYFKEANGKTSVLVLVEGSKDIGFAGDQTGGAWTSRIVKGMRDYISELKQSTRTH